MRNDMITCDSFRIVGMMIKNRKNALFCDFWSEVMIVEGKSVIRVIEVRDHGGIKELIGIDS
jgi:hypothetical protein